MYIYGAPANSKLGRMPKMIHSTVKLKRHVSVVPLVATRLDHACSPMPSVGQNDLAKLQKRRLHVKQNRAMSCPEHSRLLVCGRPWANVGHKVLASGPRHLLLTSTCLNHGWVFSHRLQPLAGERQELCVTHAAHIDRSKVPEHLQYPLDPRRSHYLSKGERLT
jgi:hypothetical protein